MIDLHSHVLFGVDDGSKSLEESLKMIEMAIKIGFSGIVCTSHFQKGKFENTHYQENFTLLKKRVKELDIPIELFPGNEIFLDGETSKYLSEKKFNTYNGTNYILIEIHPNTVFIPLKQAIKKLQEMGFIPILAHVERYSLKLSEIVELKDMKVPLQLNISSIGKNYRGRALKLFENNLIDLITSDAHSLEWRNYDLSEDIAEIKKIVGEAEFKRFSENSYNVISGKELIFYTEENIKNDDSFLKKIKKFFQ